MNTRPNIGILVKNGSPRGIPELATRLVEKNWTVGMLASFLLERLKPGNALEQLSDEVC